MSEPKRSYDPNHTTVIMTVVDTSWLPPGAYHDVFDFFGVPFMLVESADPEIETLARQQPGFYEAGPRSKILMTWFRCQDPGRVPVRHELLRAALDLVGVGTRQELEAAITALCAEAQFPPAVPPEPAAVI